MLSSQKVEADSDGSLLPGGIRSLRANKRDYAVDKLGAIDPHHSGNESVPTNEPGRFLSSRVRILSGRGAFQKHESLCGRSENNSSRSAVSRARRTKRSSRRQKAPLSPLPHSLSLCLFPFALAHIYYIYTHTGIFSTSARVYCTVCVLVALTYSNYFSKLTQCPHSFINPPHFSGRNSPFIFFLSRSPTSFRSLDPSTRRRSCMRRLAGVKNCLKNAGGSGA